MYKKPNQTAVAEKKVKKVTYPDRVAKAKSSPKKIEPKKTSNSNTANDEDIIVSNEDTTYLVEQLIYAASDNLGVKYKSGGTTKDGFDCSGLIFSTFKKFDITLPRSSADMAKIGRVLDRNEYKKGDLIFFKTFGGNRISHVGMVTEVTDDEVKFIHSSTQLGVIISSTKEAYYQRTFAQVNRVLE
jgi:murein DD-endopeptidase / murein LD-carboxypeptidase